MIKRGQTKVIFDELSGSCMTKTKFNPSKYFILNIFDVITRLTSQHDNHVHSHGHRITSLFILMGHDVIIMTSFQGLDMNKLAPEG